MHVGAIYCSEPKPPAAVLLLEDLRLLVARGAALNAQWWGGAEAALDGA